MGDVVRYTEGDREYSVYGLTAKGNSIRAASQGVNDSIGAWKEAADRALAEWRGPHSATMAAQHNEAVSAAFNVYTQLSIAASRCATFPAGFTPSSTVGSGFAAMHDGATVTAPAADGSVGAETTLLRSYATTVAASGELLPTRAATVDYDGLRAEVSYPRPLSEGERQQRIDGGADPAAVDQARVGVTEPHPVSELITLVAPTDDAQAGVARSAEVAEFTRAVAGALDDADATRLELLASHPELAAFLVPGGQPDVIAGDTALAVLQAHFATLDTADEGGDPDDKVSRDDLEAAAGDEGLPPELRAAAQYLLDNPTLYGLVDTGDDGSGPVAADGDITRSDLDEFLVANAHLRALRDHVDELDVADEGGDPDGEVSRDDLEAAAADESLPDDVRAAAQYLLDHDGAFRSVADQEEQALYGYGGGSFTTTDLLGRLINGQAYVHDSDAARDFIASLPVASDCGEGLPIHMSGDDSVRALANSGLTATLGDLTEMQVVIAHLPESPGAVRNQLITTFYDMLAQRVDGVAADQAGIFAGDPAAPGSGGANWLIYAPWASNGVRSAIDGSFSVFGINPDWGQRQAAADGNQWIFNDITARFAAFVELYEDSGGQPSVDQVEQFFADTFDEGDAEIRRGFQAYVAAMGTDDPVQRQQLMFQANTLVATHEQAGAQPYLEDVMSGVPDGFASRYVDIVMGDNPTVEVDEDLDLVPRGPNEVVTAPILELDPSGLTDADLSTTVPFGGAGDDPEVVNLDPIGGWSDYFPTSTQDWYDESGAGPVITFDGNNVVVAPIDPDASLQGTGVDAWTDYDDRMWLIHRLFEQTHTDVSLYQTQSIYEDDDGVDTGYLDSDVAAAISRDP